MVANLTRDTSEDKATVTNITNKNATLTEKVAEYTNHLSTKDTNITALRNTITNLQGEVKKLKENIQESGIIKGNMAGKNTEKR